ncbi:MAG: hypothetical protein QXS23_06525, partial [Desulfurococcaceae archaeon]
NKIIEDAKKKAEEILSDRSYEVELFRYKELIEKEIEAESEKIIKEAEKEAINIRNKYRDKVREIAIKLASLVLAIEI